MSHPDFPTSRPGEPRRLSPTDVSQFVRLEQCERYLRLRLHERAYGQRFLRDYGVAAEAIPPLLTRSGGRFEDEVEAHLEQRFRCLRFSDASRGNSEDDREQLLAELMTLKPDAACVLLQPRLRVEVSGWLFTGDLDLLHAYRDSEGALHLLIVDMKSSTGPKVEHRLQVAFYHGMVAALLAGAGTPAASIRTAILYRGPSEPDPDDELLRRHRTAAVETLGMAGGYLEIIQDAEAFLESVEDLVTGPASLAERVGAAPFAEVPFHLTYKCDGCLYQEFCLKRAAQDDDLSLIPHLTGADKTALRRQGLRTTRELAGLKVADPADEKGVELVPAPDQEAACRRIATTWPVGPRLDELIHRARRYRQWKGDEVRGLSYIPSKGYGTLPYSDAEHAPNLVRVYVDAQHDYLHDRIYLLGARVVAAENGETARSENIVRITAGPPDTAEAEAALLAEWVAAVLEAVVRLAAPDALGAHRAPIHLIFFNSWEQRLLLDALSRHMGALFAAAPALYDFTTQLAAYDSPIASFLDAEIRELKNYPLLCQSLQAVAAHLRFDWNTPEPFAERFRHRLFDERRKLEGGEEPEWYTGRSRFNSQIPLEYAYAAWGELDELPRGESRHYAGSTPELLLRFQGRRLEAMEHVAREFRGNHLTEKRAFDLPDLAGFQDRARTLAGALEEFVAIERHVELHAWKLARHAPPERRVLTGETLLARYVEADQEPYVAEQNRENARRYALRKLYEAQYRLDHPDAARIQLTREQREETKWSPEGLRVWLRLEAAGLECTLAEALAITELREGENVVVNPRWTVDERLPEAERTLFTPTPKQMLYAPRAGIARLPRLDEARVSEVPLFVEVELRESRGGQWSRGFAFPSFDRPLTEGELYSLDGCPNNFYGYWCAKVTEGLQERVSGGNLEHTLYARLDGQGTPVRWGAAEEAGQRRFAAGLLALEQAGALHDFEEGKREFIGGHGGTPILLVQGPPGTGKSYSTAFALFARLQGALAADREYRVFVSCKTHAATDVLLRNVLEVRGKLAALQAAQPEIWFRYFDDRLLTLPLFRVAAKEEPPDGIRALTKDNQKEKGQPRNADVLREQRWCVVGATPGAIYGIIKGKWTGTDDLFGHPFCDCLVLDEASQMNLPEALMAALPLCADGALVVVGDHRQMPPIVQHDWENERRRTFQEYRAFRSLFETLLERGVPTIRFSESFRLHADMAEFLRREIYAGDGIQYHSHRRRLLDEKSLEDEFVRTVLRPEHPLTVVVHGERSSQKRNLFEEGLLRPLMAALADPSGYGLEPREGLGVVVPHRAQRAALQLALMETLGEAGEEVLAAVDTVERFQGGERSVILISATESDREFLLACSKFLLDPRRLNVALSRAKQKLVLVASEEIFSLFSADEEAFAHSRIWKNLLRRTCTVPLWEGERDGTPVRVWGNGKAAGSGAAP